jgi:acetolactate synthase-1/2/3 large subunit
MAKIKVSDWVARFLKTRGVRHVFGVTGGADIHLLHSCHKEGVQVICNHHEQASAMAADCYARVNGIACAMGTSGPGATNMLTGIAGAYFDSISVLYVTGQVVKSKMSGNLGVRQYGFQETDVISMARPITKYCTQILNAKDIRYELERAIFISKFGRPGPVLVDIPDDLQRELVDPEDLAPYMFDLDMETEQPKIFIDKDIDKCIEMLKASERPVLIGGYGVRIAKAEKEFMELAELLNIPVCCSWGLNDLIPSDHPLKVGQIGINGSRAGNFTVQNSDLILSIGARLSTRETSNNVTSFARAAKIIMVDIDESEIHKFPNFGKKIDLPIVSDAKEFCITLNNKVDFDLSEQISTWKEKIKDWKTKYDPSLNVFQGHEPVDPYVFVDKLSKNLNPGALIVSDTGCAIPWLCQGFKFKKNQRLFHDFNNTAMGWAIPAAIGAHFASKKDIICVVGDGSFAMNIQELYTIQHHKLPIKIFLLNNNGYSMVRQTCDEWMDGEYVAVGPESMSFPSYSLIADSFKLHYHKIEKNHEISWVINRALKTNGPVLVNVIIPEDCKVWPKLVYGKPLENMDPALPRDEFIDNMLIPSWTSK